MPTQNFRVGEMLNKRTRNSKTWINFDGSYTTEIYAGDVHYQDENGNWHNIDTDLYDEADMDQVDFPVAKEGADVFRIMKDAAQRMKKKNILDRDMMDYQGLKVPFDCRIPRNFRRGYTIGKGQNKLKFKPVQASPSKGYVDENQRNKIIYQDAWNDTDVILEVLPNGIKETIILKTDRAPFSFSFEVDGPLEDDLTAGELRLQPAWLQDANGEKRDVSQTIRREGDKTYIDLVADVTGLTYPIEIDPTVSITSVSHIFDTHVRKSYPDDTHSGSTSLFLGGVYYQNESEIFKQEWTPMFNIDYKSVVPAGVIITSATLDLYQTYISDSSKSYQIQVYEYDYSKISTSSTYNNTIATGTGTYLNDYGSSNYNGPLSISIKNVLQNAVNSNKAKLGLYLKFAITDGFNVRFASMENADTSLRPKVSITYNIPPTAPTVTSPNGGETWNAQHTITWNAASDASIEQINSTDTQGSTYTLASSQPKVAQMFYVPSAVDMLTTATFLPTSGAGGRVRVYIANVNQSNDALLSVVAGTNQYISIGAAQTHTVTFNVLLTPNTKYAIVFEYVDTVVDLKMAGGNYIPNANSYIYNTSGVYLAQNSTDLYLLLNFVKSQNSLQYQIQLSTNNGSTWKDIVPLTSPGATSYTYDFTNEPETSLAKIRIRAYDGTSYGPWDESNGVFTIQHNQAPTVPTNLAPSGGVAKDRASVIRLSWQHNDANGDPQAKFDLQWRLQGAQTWNTVTQVTTNQYWDAPANTFPKGTIEWQVRTYDQAGLSSPFSDIQTFFAGDKPANPTITDPTNGAIVPVANPVVQWSSAGQTAYHVKLLDSNDNLLWEIQANSTNKAQTILYGLQNNTDYKIQVAIKNADNLWSDFITSNIHVSYTPPAVPIVTTTKGEGIIIISIDNPTPSGTQPNVSYNDLYRRKQSELTWTRIATNIPADASFVDYTPASGQVYEYFVRAWGGNGTYSDSAVARESISLTGVWLHEAANPLETLHQFKLVSDRSGNWQPTATMMQFAGRRLPVAEYDDTEQHSVSVKFSLLKDSGDLEALEKLIRSKNTLCYRDARGRKMFCHVFQLPVDDEVYGNTVSLTFEEVSYTEEV